jgi:hypothetical protein
MVEKAVGGCFVGWSWRVGDWRCGCGDVETSEQLQLQMSKKTTIDNRETKGPGMVLFSARLTSMGQLAPPVQCVLELSRGCVRASLE